jgi:hypothetical protein
MIREIISEIKYCFWIVAILSWGLMLCDIGNRQALWEYECQNWEYNLTPSEGSGWIDSIVDKTKFK